MSDDLERGFHAAMINVYVEAKKQCGYSPTRFLQSVTEHGGLAAAKDLLRSKQQSDGVTRLWEEKRLDLSMEALVLKSPWSSLFEEEELRTARARLESLNYVPGE